MEKGVEALGRTLANAFGFVDDAQDGTNTAAQAKLSLSPLCLPFPPSLAFTRPNRPHSPLSRPSLRSSSCPWRTYVSRRSHRTRLF